MRCLQIPTLVTVDKIVFKRGGIGPQQEGGEGFQTHKIRGGAIRAKAWLGALGRGVVGPGRVITLGIEVMEEVEGNNQNKEGQKEVGFDLFQFGIGFGFNDIPISRLSAGPFIITGGNERVRPVNKCGWTI